MKKILSIILTMALMLTVLPLGVFSITTAAATSGTTGECTWSLDGTTLTISGNGEMDDYNRPWDNEITEVIIESGVTNIGSSAFSGCTSLKTVTIGNDVKIIENSAFSGCKSIEVIEIPDSVVSIGDYAFNSCSALETITIGRGVKSIGEDAFAWGMNRSTLRIYDLAAWCNIKFDGPNSNPITNCEFLHLNDERINSLVIPYGVTKISDYAFYGFNAFITSVEFPTSLLSIGDFAFSKFKYLSSVMFPNSLQTIGISAFEDCKRLDYVFLSSGILNIGENAFLFCEGLDYVDSYAADSLLNVGLNAFYSTNWYNKLSNGPVYIGSVLYSYKGTAPSEVIVREGTYGISKGALANKDTLESVILPKTMVLISEGAITGCKNISINFETSNDFYRVENGCLIENANDRLIAVCKNFTIPDNIKIIGENVFYNRTDITSITIPDSVTNIGESAFSGCTGISKIVIPDSVTNLGMWAFYGCSGLIDVKISKNLKKLERTFTNCIKLKNVKIPDGITEIGDYAFDHCTGLISVFVPDSVKTIGEFAFYDCSLLKTVFLGKNIKVIKRYAFQTCSSLKEVYYNNTQSARNSISIIENYYLEKSKWYYETEHQHIYGEWETLTEATTSSEGVSYRECTMCDKRVERVIPRTLTFKSKTLALQSNISIVFRVDPVYFSSYGYSNPVVIFNLNGVEYPVSEYTVNSTSGLYEFSFNGIAPHQMNDMVSAVLTAEYDGEVYTSATQEYSIFTYCNNQITKYSENASYKKLMALLVDILNYGAAAQNYQNYKTDDLVNAKLTASQKALGNQDVISYTSYKNMNYKATPASGVATFKAATLALKDSITIIFKFELKSGKSLKGVQARVSTNNGTWVIGSSEFVYDSASKRYSINFEGLNPSQMKEPVGVYLVKNGERVSNVARYNIEAYGLSSAAMGDPGLAALVEAMVRYGRSAKTYVG